jgi:acetyl-CoA carboxylase carboxyltransferase component
MGFKDRLGGTVERLRQQAAGLAEQAQQGYQTAAERLEQLQARQRVSALLEELGRLTYLKQSGRAAPGAEERIAAIVTEVAALEASAGPVSADAPLPGGGQDSDPGDASVPAAPASGGDAQTGPMPSGTYGGEEEP